MRSLFSNCLSHVKFIQFLKNIFNLIQIKIDNEINKINPTFIYLELKTIIAQLERITITPK